MLAENITNTVMWFEWLSCIDLHFKPITQSDVTMKLAKLCNLTNGFKSLLKS